MKIIENLITKYRYYQSMPANVIALLDEEELNGARMANKFRYLACFTFLIFAVINIPNYNSMFGYFINFGALSIFITLTVVHTYFLHSSTIQWNKNFESLYVFFDNTIIAVTIWNWYQIGGDENPNFMVKTPLMFYFIFPIALTLIQFRIKLVFFSLACFLFYFFLFNFYSFLNSAPSGHNWTRYVLGNEIIYSDALVTKPLLFVNLALLISYTIYRSFVMLTRIARVESQKTSLARYFSPNLITEITSQPNVIQLGKRQRVTVLFSDIRKFTSFSESMDPEELSNFLTDYRKRMTKIVFQLDGTLDKFIGDAVMATFGTPLPSKIPGQDSKNAVTTAKLMLSELDDLNAERLTKNEKPIHIGIGIHVGEVFAGNIGSEERMEYSVIGDTVNTASRIESACKTLNQTFLISEDVWKEIGEPLEFQMNAPVQLPGKEMPITLYSWNGPLK
jgi:adenylate cyclase